MMAERHWLRRLQMGEARHHRIGMFLGPRQQRALQAEQARRHFVDRIAHPEAEIGRHLIVAAARGMQPSGGRPDELRQPRFRDHMNIFEVEVDGHAIGFIFSRDPVQPLGYCLRILALDDALLGQHRDMRLGPGDILFPQTLVERDGGIYLAHDRRGAGRKPATPHAVGAFSLGTCFARANDTAPGCRSGGLR
jgi:hypothetical protein